MFMYFIGTVLVLALSCRLWINVLFKLLKLTKMPISAITALARLLGRQAAKELVEAEQADPVTPLNKDEGARE